MKSLVAPRDHFHGSGVRFVSDCAKSRGELSPSPVPVDSSPTPFHRSNNKTIGDDVKIRAMQKGRKLPGLDSRPRGKGSSRKSEAWFR